MRPEVVPFSTPARCARGRRCRGAIRRIRWFRQIRFPLSSVGPARSRPASTTKECSDASDAT